MVNAGGSDKLTGPTGRKNVKEKPDNRVHYSGGLGEGGKKEKTFGTLKPVGELRNLLFRKKEKGGMGKLRHGKRAARVYAGNRLVPKWRSQRG